MKNNIKESPLVNNLRETLKNIFQNELENLPQYLEGLEPRDRLNYLLKIMPFVLPKVESVHSKEGEPFSL